MKVAIDKKCLSKIKDLEENEYIYIFDDEPLQFLQQLNINCIHKDYVEEVDVDVNLTNYKINSIKRAKVEDINWNVLPPKKDYKFAIIVPNYNNDHGNYQGKTYFQNCIESILKQTYKNFELIIVDDMSIDTSVETVEKYVDKRIHLIKNKRKRYNGGSRNVGIEYALDNLEFDYICFLDSDDWWIDNTVLESINRRLYDHDMMVIGCQMLYNSGLGNKQYNKFENYEDLYFCINKVWCTAWSRVIKKEKIVYFCEDTLMEDRVWSYKQADNIDFDKVINLNKICYIWNRMNRENSVSLSGSDFWNASVWCHIGHQLQFMANMKHKEFKNILEKRIQDCIKMANNGQYNQS